MEHYPGVDNNLNSTVILPQGAAVPPLTYTPRTQCIGTQGFVSLTSLTFIYIYTPWNKMSRKQWVLCVIKKTADRFGAYVSDIAQQLWYLCT